MRNLEDLKVGQFVYLPKQRVVGCVGELEVIQADVDEDGHADEEDETVVRVNFVRTEDAQTQDDSIDLRSTEGDARKVETLKTHPWVVAWNTWCNDPMQYFRTLTEARKFANKIKKDVVEVSIYRLQQRIK